MRTDPGEVDTRTAAHPTSQLSGLGQDADPARWFAPSQGPTVAR